MSNLIFMTGSTGVLGRELLKEILTTSDDFIAVLVRSKNRLSHSERVRRILASVGCGGQFAKRIKVIEGDVTKENFGISETNKKYLIKHCNIFFHIAALTALNGTEKECEQINVGGTSNALALAKQFRSAGKLERFVYFSTAFVAGSVWTYLSKEDELPQNPAFANYYESSKYKAETSIRHAMSQGLPTTIIRPSIVVGDSRDGAVSDFNVIYPFIKLYAHGILTQIPTDIKNTFNIVPIDFVIKATTEIVRNPNSINKTFHVVSPNPPEIGMFLSLVKEFYKTVPPITVVSPEHFKKETMNESAQMAFSILEPYLGYLNGHLTFDMTNTREILRKARVELPKTDKMFLKVLMDYAIKVGYLLI